MLVLSPAASLLSLPAPSAGPLLAIGAALLGCALLGGALRFRGSAELGSLVGIGAYLLIGVGWAVAAMASYGTSVASAVASPIAFLREAGLYWVLIWPVRMLAFLLDGFRFPSH